MNIRDLNKTVWYHGGDLDLDAPVVYFAASEAEAKKYGKVVSYSISGITSCKKVATYDEVAGLYQGDFNYLQKFDAVTYDVGNDTAWEEWTRSRPVGTILAFDPSNKRVRISKLKESKIMITKIEAASRLQVAHGGLPPRSGHRTAPDPNKAAKPASVDLQSLLHEVKGLDLSAKDKQWWLQLIAQDSKLSKTLLDFLETLSNNQDTRSRVKVTPLSPEVIKAVEAHAGVPKYTTLYRAIAVPSVEGLSVGDTYKHSWDDISYWSQDKTWAAEFLEAGLTAILLAKRFKRSEIILDMNKVPYPIGPSREPELILKPGAYTTKIIELQS